MNVALVGLRGSGKTTVGRLLAERVGRVFIDIDQLIAEHAGCTIRDIFATEGEEGFRRRERDQVWRMTWVDRAVIALGGGAVDDPENRRVLRPVAYFVWLRALPETLWERVRTDPHTSDSRPDLTPAGGLEEVRQLTSRRYPIFESIADLTIDTDWREPAGVADEIERWLAAAEAGRRGGTP